MKNIHYNIMMYTADHGGMYMLNRQSPIPLYRQLRDTLRHWIESGTYKPGDTLPPEPDLETQFDVSRITVRQAIVELVQEGLLVRERGRGTFVREPKITQNLNQITSWAETIMAMGMTAKTVECKLEEGKPPLWAARLLGIGIDEKVVIIKRVRSANDEPMCIMTNYILSRYAPGLVKEGLSSESLYETLEKKYHIVLGRAEETVEAVVADDYQAKTLKTQAKSPLLSVTRITFDQNDTPFEVVKAVSRGDKYQYSTTLTGRPKS
jgi:GntR family transcriptional regulator